MEQQELTESQAIDAIISDRLGTATLPTDLTKPSNAVSAQGQTPKEKGTHSSPPKEAMSQKALAERLRCDSEHLASIRDYPIVLADYTRERDPDSMAWEYKSDSQLYFPLD